MVRAIVHSWLLFCSGLVWINLSTASLGQELQAGAAKRIITPDPLLPISGGVGPGVPSKSKQGDLTARALVPAQRTNDRGLRCPGRARISICFGRSCSTTRA